MVVPRSPGEHAYKHTADRGDLMHPFPVDPKDMRDPLEDEPQASGHNRSGAEAMPMRRRTRDATRALLAALSVVLVVVVLIALL
jgi:hypothetical protein